MINNHRTNHPGWAAVLSFIFNGLGQLYNGQIVKGLVIIFLSAVGMFIFLVGSIFIGLWLWGKIIPAQELTLGLVLFFVGMIFICILGIYSIFDAYRIASNK